MKANEAPQAARPRILTIPGLWNSGADHWQTRWERERDDCARIELGCWDDPIRNVWMSRIDQAIYEARGDIVLVAHSLGCHAVAWWAKQLGPSGSARVRGPCWSHRPMSIEPMPIRGSCGSGRHRS